MTLPRDTRLGRGVRSGLLSLGLLLVFLLALCSAVVLHANTAPVRAVVTQQANALLATALYGEVEIERITQLSMKSIELTHVDLHDELGNAVVELKTVRIELDSLSLLADIVFGGDTLNVVVSHARAEGAVVRMIPDAEGNLTLARAFTPRPRPKRDPKREHSDRYVRVWLPIVELAVIDGEVGVEGWEHLGVLLAGVRGKLLFSPKGIAVDVERFGANVTGLSGSTIRGTGTYTLRAPGPMQADFTGRIDDAEIHAHARLEGDQIALEATAPRLHPETLRELFEQWPLLDPVSARVKAQGRYPQLDTQAHVTVDGGGEVEVEGVVNLAEKVSVQLDADVSEFNLQSLSKDAPATSISGRCNLGAELSSSDITVALLGTTDATTIGGVAVPATEFDLDADESGVSGNVYLQEPGAPVTAEGAYENGTLTLDAHVPQLSLSRQRRLPPGLSGITALDARLVLDDKQLELQATGSITRLGVKPLSVARVEFELRLAAPVDDLAAVNYDVDARVSKPEVSGYGFDRGRVRANGDRNSVLLDVDLQADDGRKLAAKGRLSLSAFTARDATLRFERQSLALRADVRHLDLNRGVVDAPKIEIDGPQGKLRGSLDLAPGRVQAKLTATNLDIGRVTSQLRLGSVPVTGSMNIEAEFSIDEDIQRGQLRAGASKVSVMNWGRSDLSVTADLDGRSFSGTINGKDELGFTVQGNWNTQLGGHPLTSEAWMTATGTSEFGVLGVDLAPLALAVPNGLLSSIDGKVGVRTLLQRTSNEGFPNAFVEVGASITQATLSVGDTPTDVSNIELYMNNAFDTANSRMTSVSTAGDVHGQLLSVTSSLKVDPQAWLDDPVGALRRFRKSDLSIAVAVPERWLSHFPGWSSEGIDAIVEGQLAVYGTLVDPKVSLQASARQLRAPGVETGADLGVNLSGTYAPHVGDLDVKVVGAGRGRSLVLGRAQGNVPWEKLGQADGWNLNGKFILDRFPLSILSPLVNNQLTGEVNGQFELAQGDQSSLLAHLSVNRLTSGRAVLGSGVLTMKGSPGELLSTITLKEGERLLTARASASAKTKQVPMPAQLENIQIELQTRRLDAGALGPLMEDVLARLSGDLDASLTVSLTHETSVVPGEPHRWNSAISGNASLANGSAYVESLGLELTDMSVQVTARALGNRTEIELSDLQAKARSDDVNLEGQGQIVLENSQLTSGTAGLRLRSVPITLQGLSLGKAQGQALLTATRERGWDGSDQWSGKDYLAIDVDLLDWQMRATPSASRELIQLDRPAEIVVVQQQLEDDVDPDLLPLRIVIDLGPRATFRLADLEIPLGGNLQLDQTDEAVMRGTLKLQRGGRIPIFGHVFTVVDGKLRLDPKQPSNPTLDITLNGRNPEGQPVDLHIGGTLKEPRTDPAPDELQALLGGGAGAALSGGVQALGVNQLLGESVQLRVDSTAESEEAESSYTAAVQIDQDLWFEANYQRGQDNTLNQDQSGILSGTVDYRFHNNWSLRTKVGTTGGSVDLLWQYRY